MEGIVFWGILGLIALIRYFIKSTRNERDEDNIDLSKHLSICPYHSVNTKEGKKELRKILSDPEIRKEAEERRSAYNEKKRKEADLKRKDTIIKRTFSYNYENVLYEIFAPYATNRRYEVNGQTWKIGYNIGIENDFVISELSRLLGLSSEKAYKLFEEFEKNDMIDIDSRYIDDGTIIGKRVKADRCRLGSLLVYNWNIISNEDMNLSKWIEQHPDRESKDSMDKRRGVIKEHIPFKGYIRRYGDYSIVCEYRSVKIQVKNGHTLYLFDSQIAKIGLSIKDYQYKLNYLIESISEQLFVDIDDEQHTLCVEKGD